MHIKRKALEIKPLVNRSPLPGYEYGRGYGVMALPFTSGHVLALREFPENDFAPYRTVWHRTPDHSWSIYVDGPSHDTACPRYYGRAVAHVQSAHITLSWIGAHRLRIEMDQPALVWEIVMKTSPLINAMNAISVSLPERIWRAPVVMRTIEKLGDLLFDAGTINLSGRFPNGHAGILMPRRMFPITSSTATLNGASLGQPTRSKENPMIGKVSLPARPIFAMGRYYFSIQDQEAYARTPAELHNAYSTNLNTIMS